MIQNGLTFIANSEHPTLQGVLLSTDTQGVALGYVQVAPLGRIFSGH